jgi:hypothetical protein
VPQVLGGLARRRSAVLHRAPTGVLAHEVLPETSIALHCLDRTLIIGTGAYSHPCTTAAAAENLAAQLLGRFALDTPDANRAQSIHSFPIYIVDSGLTIRARPNVATAISTYLVKSLAIASHSSLTASPAQGTVVIDERSKLHVQFARLSVLRFMLERSAIAILSNGGQ